MLGNFRYPENCFLRALALCEILRFGVYVRVYVYVYTYTASDQSLLQVNRFFHKSVIASFAMRIVKE